MDRLTGMRIFVAAVEEGSLAAASRLFGLSAAMAGKHVNEMETGLNARLLQRTTRRLSLTDTGRTYYERCKRILEAFDEANREARDAQGTVRGTLRVAAPVTFGAMHLGAVVGRYLTEHAQVKVEVLLDDRYADLIDAGVDVAIRIGRLEDPGLVVRRIGQCRMVLCAAPSYLQRQGIPRTPDDLAGAQRLAFSEAVSAGDWTLRDAANRSYLIDGPCRMAANNTQMLLAAALEGAGIAFGPAFVFGAHLQRGELVELLPGLRADDLAIQAVYPSARRIPLKVRRFVDFLDEAFANDPPWERKADF